ncbi:MAG: sulfotransferase [Actinomycetota bacterium]|nr:sulfotransferase [Actinomycetota bacterium]
MPSTRGFPTFLVIGAAKAGTTSLYHYLGQHPQIFMSPVKEPRFFALEGHPLDFRGPGDERLREKTTTTLEAYRELFAGVRNERAVGEASVLYLHHQAAPEAIARYIPDVKLVAVLRNPVERAYSGFLYQTRDGYEPLADFEEALRAEPRRIADGWYYSWHYRDQGFYHRNLARYFDRFDPSMIRVYLYEDLDQDPHRVLANLFGFLGVDEGFRPDVGMRYNPSGRPRSARLQRVLTQRHSLKEAAKAVIPERWGHRVIARLQPANLVRAPIRVETRASLVEGYNEDIRRLEHLIGRDLSHWLR